MAGSHGKIWKKRVLLPLWLVQLGALVIFLGLTSFAIWVWNRVSDEVDFDDYDIDEDTADEAVDTGAAINFSFIVFTMLVDFAEMVLYCTHRLSPVIFLVLQCIVSAVWTFFLIVTIIAAVRGVSSGGVIFLVLVIFLTSIALLAYSASTVHKKRKGTLYRGDYAAASNGMAPSYEPSPYNQTTGYTGASSHQNPFRDPSPAPPYNPHATHSAPQPTGEAAGYYGGGASYEMQHGPGR